jgi:hypothetical protein
MIKVKISNARKFAFSSNPSVYDITLKNKKEVETGKLYIDFTKKTIRVNFNRALTDYNDDVTEYEQLAVLKEIFYSFCITECKKRKNIISEHIEEYKFIDEQKREDRKTIIDYIMCYNVSEFDVYKRKEKIISHIRISYHKIKYEIKESKSVIELEPIADFSKKEMNVYKKILLKYLKSKGYNGKLIDVSEEVNRAFRIEFPYCYCKYNLFYAFKYEIIS